MQIDVLSEPNVVGVGEEGEIGFRPGKYWKQGSIEVLNEGQIARSSGLVFSAEETVE